MYNYHNALIKRLGAYLVMSIFLYALTRGGRLLKPPSYFRAFDERNQPSDVVIGKRKREIGIVVLAKFTPPTVNKKFAKILKEKLIEKENLLCTNVERKKIVTFPSNLSLLNQ